MARPSKIKQLEVLVQKNDGNLEWTVLATVAENQKVNIVQDMLIISFDHEQGAVHTYYNLNNFLGYSIVR